MSSPTLDQYLHLRIEADGLRAVLEVDARAPQTGVDRITIEALLAGRAVPIRPPTVKLIDQALEAIAQPRTGPLRLTLAEGTPPVPGTDGRLIFEPGLDPRERRHAPEPGADGDANDQSVDHYQGARYTLVRPGDRLAHVVPPVPGSDGCDVLGRAVPAREGRACTLKTDSSISIDHAGVCTALVGGVVEYQHPRLAVVQVLKLPGSVDFATGNIDFPGSVVVGRSVKDCFQVKASRDLAVMMMVEAAELASGRDMTIEGGMAAKGQGQVHAGRDLRARYLNNARAHVGRDMRLENELINSHVTVGRDVLSPQATMEGGSLTVGRQCVLGEVGSPGGVVTELRLGCVPAPIEAADLARALLPQLRSAREGVQKALDGLKVFGPRMNPEQAERHTELTFEQQRLTKLIGTLELRLAKVEQLIEERTKVDLRVQGCVHAHVRLVLPHITYEVRSPIRGPVHLTLSAQGEVQLCNASGTALRLTDHLQARLVGSSEVQAA
jgi:uncharacterized protein (DUF342 family)